MTIGSLPVCFDCARLVLWPHCTAFGGATAIPHQIASGLDDHQEPVEGDHGRLFKQATEAELQAITRRHGFPVRDKPEPAEDMNERLRRWFGRR